MVADVLLTTLRQVWQTLEASGARLAVMGGLALASWKHVRATRDVDLLVEVPADDVDRLLAVLILHKLLAGQMIDRADCVALLRLQRAELDWAYLKNWAARLAVSDGLAEAWAEAFPGEPAP